MNDFILLATVENRKNCGDYGKVNVLVDDSCGITD